MKPEFRDLWADYICRYIEEFQKRGYEVERISVQNEPKAVQTWDSCIFTAEDEKTFLRDHLYPALIRHDLDDIEMFVWDHNKERIYERVRDTVDETTKDMISGAAFHWYSGDHFEALDLLRQQYPALKLITSESCIEYRFLDKDAVFENAAKLAHEVLGDLNHGMNAFYDWNLLLDEQGGPNYVGNWCHAAFMYDTKEKLLHPQLLQRYYWHFSNYIVPGSVRVGLSRYTDKLEAAAFRRPDGLLAVVLFNAGTELVSVNLRLDGCLAELTVGAKTIISALI